MYAKLVYRNAKRSAKDYLIDIVTLTICVTLFYAFLDRYQAATTSRILELLMKLQCLVSGIKLAGLLRSRCCYCS